MTAAPAISSVASASPVVVNPRATGSYGAGRSPPDLTARRAQFDQLAATALDTTGKVGDEARVQAYAGLQSMAATGQLIGVGDDRLKVHDQVSYDSDIGQRAQRLQSSLLKSMKGAVQAGDAQAGLKAMLATFDGLSSTDQNLLFQTSLNAADRSGSRPHADAGAWRDNVEAQVKVVSFMKDSGVVGPDGALDQKAAAAKAVSDPKFAAALKLSLRRDNSSADWTRSVTQLLGGGRPADRVDLSDAAKALLGPSAQAPASAPPASYRQGSLVSTTA